MTKTPLRRIFYVSNASAAAQTSASLSRRLCSLLSTGAPPSAVLPSCSEGIFRLPRPSSTLFALSTWARIAAVSARVRSRWDCMSAMADSRAWCGRYSLRTWWKFINIVRRSSTLGAACRTLVNAAKCVQGAEAHTSSGAMPMMPMSSRKFRRRDLAIRLSSKARSRCFPSLSSLYDGARRRMLVSSSEGSRSSSYGSVSECSSCSRSAALIHCKRLREPSKCLLEVRQAVEG